MEKKQTAMQILIENIRRNYENLSPEGKNFANRFFLVDAQHLLSVEKSNIVEAYTEGHFDSKTVGKFSGNAEHYYNQTFSSIT